MEIAERLAATAEAEMLAEDIAVAAAMQAALVRADEQKELSATKVQAVHRGRAVRVEQEKVRSAVETTMSDLKKQQEMQLQLELLKIDEQEILEAERSLEKKEREMAALEEHEAAKKAEIERAEQQLAEERRMQDQYHEEQKRKEVDEQEELGKAEEAARSFHARRLKEEERQLALHADELEQVRLLHVFHTLTHFSHLLDSLIGSAGTGEIDACGR